MQHRAYCYIQFNGESVRVNSQPFDTEIEAINFLDHMMTFPGYTGGDIETNVPGIGYVLGGEQEAETAIICQRRKEV